MLTKKQLEYMTACSRRMACCECEAPKTLKRPHRCTDMAAKTALAYRDMLEKIVGNKCEPDKMYLYAEQAEKMLRESEGE